MSRNSFLILIVAGSCIFFEGCAQRGAKPNPVPLPEPRPVDPFIQPSVTKVSPDFGHVSGGTKISIQGSNFSENTRVSVGDADCVNLFVKGDSELECTTPKFDRRGGSEIALRTTGRSERTRSGFHFRYAAVSSLVSGDEKTCALLGGGVKCWGNNAYGALDPKRGGVLTVPSPVFSWGKGVQSVAVGRRFTCAAFTDRVECFDAKDSRHFVQKIMNADQPTVLASGGDHVCFLNAGRVYCLGDAYRVGAGSKFVRYENQTAFSPVLDESDKPIQNIRKIEAGCCHTCALDLSGHLSCWGAVPEDGMPFLAARLFKDEKKVPIRFSHIYMGGMASCGIRLGSSELICWGDDELHVLNYRGKRVEKFPMPSAIGIDTPFRSFAFAARLSCLVDTKGAVTCLRASGRKGDVSDLDDPEFLNDALKIREPEFSHVSVSDSSEGLYHACGLTPDNRVLCWGRSWRFFANERPVLEPLEVSGL